MGNPIPTTPPTTPPEVDPDLYYCITTLGYRTMEGDPGCSGDMMGSCQWCYKGDAISNIFDWNCQVEIQIACFLCEFITRSEEIIAVLGGYGTNVECQMACLPMCIEY